MLEPNEGAMIIEENAMRYFILILLCVLALAAVANDSHVVGDGGRVHRMNGKHTTIRMVRERVQMDVYAGYFDVDVHFLFKNDGPKTTVQMGFPESGGGDINSGEYSHHTGFLSFHTWVDDQPVTAKRLPASAPECEYRTFWVKTVPFAAGQSRTVRVQYSSPTFDESTGEEFINYDFTGGNWKGAVDESLLEISFHQPGAHLVWGGGDGQKFETAAAGTAE